MKESLRQKEDLLDRKELILKNYELSLRGEDILKQPEAKIDDSAIKLAIKQIEEENNNLNDDLKMHLEHMHASQATAEEREQELNRVQQELEQKDKRLVAKDSGLAEIQALLQQKEEELSKKELLFRDHYSRLTAGSKDYSQALENKEKDLQQQAQIVGQQKDLISEELPFTLDKLAKLREEWETKENLLKEKVGQLLKDKEEVEQMLAKVDSNVSLVTQKEDEIVQKIEQLERDKRLLDREEDRVIQKVQKLELAEGKIKERERNIRQLEQTISKEETRLREEVEKWEQLKSIAPELPKLEREYNKLRSKYEKIEFESVAKREMLRKDEEGNKRKQRELEEQELIVKTKEDQLVKEEYELVQAKENMAKGMFEEYLRQQVNPYSGMPATNLTDKKYDYIYSLIEKARGCIAVRSLQEAQLTINQIEGAMQSVEESERRVLVYDIMELKTDIKLATLS